MVLRVFLSMMMLVFMLHAEVVESNVSDNKSFDGKINHIVYDGNTTFILQGTKVKSYQVSADGILTLLDEVKVPTKFYSGKMYLSAGKLYVFSWDGGSIIDVSNPSSLKLQNTHIYGTNMATIKENTIFELSGNHLTVIDANNSEYPKIVSDTDFDNIGSWTNSLKLSGNKLFILEGLKHIYIVDISSTLSPHLTGRYDYNITGEDSSSKSISGMCASINKLYFFADGKLSILNISDPSNITEIASLIVTSSTWSKANTIKIKGDRLYLSFTDTTGDYINIYRIKSDGTLETLNTNENLSMDMFDTDNHKLIFANDAKLTVLDIEDPTNTQILSVSPYVEWADQIIQKNDQLFIAQGKNIYIYDNSNTDEPVLNSTFHVETETGKYIINKILDINDTFMFQQNGNRLKIYNIEDLDNIQKLADYNFTNSNFLPEMVKLNSYVYAQDIDSRFYIINTEDPSNPNLTATLDINISDTNITEPFPILIKVTNDYAYFVINDDGWPYKSSYLKIVDISDKSNPILINSLDLNASGCWSGDYYNNKLYLGCNTKAVVIDVNDTTNLQKQSFIIGGDDSYIDSLKITNGYLYLANTNWSTNNSKLTIYNLNNSDLNTSDRVYNLPGTSWMIKVISEPYIYGVNYNIGGWGIIKLTGDKMSTSDDSDGDGYADDEDAFPNDPTEWKDTDNDGIGNNADDDDDNDGISDADEIKYGLNPQNANDADEDADGDGFSNKDEINAHTNPNDPNEHPDGGNNNNDDDGKSFKGDFNGDGVNDVIVYRKSDGNLYALIVSNDGTSSTFRKIFSGLTHDSWDPINVADYNGDGADDVLVQRKTDGNLYTLILNGDGTTTINKIVSHLSNDNWEILNTPYSKSFDINGDGKIDILVRRKSDGNLYALISNDVGTQSTFRKIASGFSSDTWKIINNADFNGDGKTDILAQRTTDGNLYVLLANNDGTTTIKKAMSRLTMDTWKLINVADFSGDGKADVLVQRKTDGNLYTLILDNNGNYKIHKIASHLATDTWKMITTADYNGDGKTDILAHRLSDGNLYTLIVGNDGTSATLHKVMSRATNDTWHFADEAADCNGDGKSDILALRVTDGNLYTLLVSNDGTSASLHKIASRLDHDTWNIINIAEYNGDGKTDMLMQRVTDGNLYTLITGSDGTSASLHKIASRLTSDAWYIAK